MADAVNKKTYIGEELFYQDLNDQNDEFVARINERLEESEVSASATANKVARRDATGKLAGDITGNAATATAATTATSVAGGAAGKMPYQSGADATAFTGAGTENQYMRKGATTPDWANLYDAFTVIDSAVLAISQKQILAHGLGRRPVFMQTSLLCVIAEQGYSIDDEVFNLPNFATNTIQYFWGSSMDAMNITTQTPTAALYIPHKTTNGLFVAITWADWKFRIRIL